MLYNTGEHRLLDIIQLKKDLINFKDIARKKNVHLVAANK